MVRGLHHEPGTDSASPVGERRVHDLEPSPPLRDDDATTRDHVIGCRSESDVPTPVPGAEVVAEVGKAGSSERAAVVLILSRIPVLDLKLDDGRPESFVRFNRRIEGAHSNCPVRSRVLT